MNELPSISSISTDIIRLCTLLNTYVSIPPLSFPFLPCLLPQPHLSHQSLIHTSHYTTPRLPLSHLTALSTLTSQKIRSLHLIISQYPSKPILTPHLISSQDRNRTTHPLKIVIILLQRRQRIRALIPHNHQILQNRIIMNTRLCERPPDLWSIGRAR